MRNGRNITKRIISAFVHFQHINQKNYEHCSKYEFEINTKFYRIFLSKSTFINRELFFTHSHSGFELSRYVCVIFVAVDVFSYF